MEYALMTSFCARVYDLW